MRLFPLLALSALVAVGCQNNSTHPSMTSTEYRPGVAESAEQVRPIGTGGTAPTAPSATMETVDGQSTTLVNVYKTKPTALVFYRGGWCPYCNAHLAELAKIDPKLREMGFQIVAVSPDRPSKLAKSIDKQDLTYTLLSDADAELTKAFGLAFKVDQPTLTKYRGYGIDLEAASGHDHHILPVPAVYLIDTEGRIRFAYWNADYKTRLSGEQLLSAARSISP